MVSVICSINTALSAGLTFAEVGIVADLTLWRKKKTPGTSKVIEKHKKGGWWW